VRDKYGENACCFLGNYGTWKPKSIVRALARVQHKPTSYGNKLANLIPDDARGKSPTIEKAVEASPELLQYPNIIEPAKKMDRMVSRPGVHASGFVICDKDLTNLLPQRRTTDPQDKKKHIMVTQMEMNDVEALGYIKFDFLGIKNLDVIQHALQLIKQNHGVDIDLEEIDIEDPKVYDLICTGMLGGIFQLEDSLRGITVKMQPRSLHEISVINAIGRPGPLDAGLLDIYLQCRSTGVPPEDMPSEMAELLERTHYTFVYQEQVMKIAVELASFSMPDADGLRKAIGKKKPKEMAKYKQMFIDGGVETNILTKEQLTQLWEDLESYADYAFNAAHSYAYSLLGYWQCWLKTYYPREFMTALMTAEDDLEKLSSYISESRSLGLDVRGPDVNKSNRDFTERNGVLYWQDSRISSSKSPQQRTV
jgi:DNA polymerase-3 subunit alpha